MEDVVKQIVELSAPTSVEGFVRYLNTLTSQQLKDKLAALKADQEKPARTPNYSGVSRNRMRNSIS